MADTAQTALERLTAVEARRDPPLATDEVLNQAPPRVGIDEFADNVPLVEAVERHDGGWARERLHEAGRLVGSAEFREWAELANRRAPELRTHDRYGRRIDEVSYDASYHEILRRAVGSGVSGALAWREAQPGAHVARGALFFLFSQGEPGHACPVSMTYAAVPALRADPKLATEWEPLLTATEYDPRLVPAAEKGSAISGMAMTEKQGGSDLRANTTRAVELGDGDYVLTGHKWFCSAPMSDMFLVLAQTDEGLSCFHVPRVLPDGQRNVFRIRRLKDKLGDRSNASSEVEFEGTLGRIVGEPGRGVRTIIEMVNHTRLDCVLATAAGMRECVTEAVWHAAHRRAFGKRLIEQPLMVNVLADLCLESEAATVTALRLARAYDEDASEKERAFRRLATAVSKYWVCKRGPGHAAEALECLGGNGYTEDFRLARRYRQQPLLSIWEGSGNVNALDVVRALNRSPETLEAFFGEIEASAGADARLDAYLAKLRGELGEHDDIESRARRLAERIALALQASLLVRYSPPEVADAFGASRLDDANRGHEYGTLPTTASAAAIVARHAPSLG